MQTKTAVTIAENKTVLRKLIERRDGYYIRLNGKLVKVDCPAGNWYLASLLESQKTEVIEEAPVCFNWTGWNEPLRKLLFPQERVA